MKSDRLRIFLGMIKPATIVLGMVLCFIIIGPAPALKAHEDRKSQVIISEGAAPLTAQGRNVARQQALRLARLNALEGIINQLLPPRQILNRISLLENGIYPHLEKYIMSYRIISEGEKEALYLLSTETTFDLVYLKEDLRRLGFGISEKASLQFTVFLFQREEQQCRPVVWLEQGVSEVLSQQGHTIGKPEAADTARLEPLLSSWLTAAPPTDNPAELNRYAKKSPVTADIVQACPGEIAIWGVIEQRQPSTAPTSQPASGGLTLRLFLWDIKSSSIIFSSNQPLASSSLLSVKSPDEPASNKLVQEIVKNVLAQNFSELTHRQLKVSLRIENLPDYASLLKIKEFAEKSIPEVKKVEIREFAQGGQAILTITSPQDTDIIMNQLQLKSPAGVAFQIRKLEDDILRLTMENAPGSH